MSVIKHLKEATQKLFNSSPVRSFDISIYQMVDIFEFTFGRFIQDIIHDILYRSLIEYYRDAIALQTYHTISSIGKRKITDLKRS